MSIDNNQMSITYLLNSGFALRCGTWALVFDDYQEPSGCLAKILSGCQEIYFFASHAHYDHFDSHILQYSEMVTRYFFSKDIRHTVRAKAFSDAKVTYLPRYTEYDDGRIQIKTFSSTDAGTSFFVVKDAWRIFHAGDFNWWHWQGDTIDNQQHAKESFFQQMDKMDGLSADVAFFPVDGRLEQYEALGAREFCHRTKIAEFIAMHRVGYPRWQPPADFFPADNKTSCWAPLQPGESIVVSKGGEAGI